MAGRSARARSKLEKISSSSAPSAPTISHTQPGASGAQALPLGQIPVSKSTSFDPNTGLLTPTASSIATGSSSGHSSSTHYGQTQGGGAGGGRHGFSFYNKNGSAVRKSALRAIFEGQSEKIRGRLEDAIRNKKNSSSGAGAGAQASSSSAKKLADIRAEKLPPIKVWGSGGDAGTLVGWEKLQRDHELWFPDGDTYIYLSPQGHPSHQFSHPSFRIKSSVLRETESLFLIAALTDSQHPIVAPAPRAHSGGGRPPTPPTPGSPMRMSFERTDSIERIPSHAGSQGTGSNLSQTISNTGSATTGSTSGEPIKYHCYFPAPVGLSREQVLKHHLTTRNVFAVLFRKSLVGVTLGETLLDIVERLDIYIPSTASSPQLQRQPSSTSLGRKRKNRALDTDGVQGNVARVLSYLLDNEFDDFRNCPDVAAGMLKFAEQFQLGELWREAFCHCVGMLNRMEGGREYMEITPITKALIDRASLEIQVRVGCADARLAAFQYDDMWPTISNIWAPSRLAFDRFQKFLVKHYQHRFGAWPPPPHKHSEAGGGSGGWGAFGLGGGGGGTGAPAGFSRQIYLTLQRDFAALYDYLVDKDVQWCYPLGEPSPPSGVGPGISTSTLGTVSGGNNNPKNKPRLISPGKKHFRADDDNLQMTDILIGFDNSNGFPHIPHPYPLVPEVKNSALFKQSATAGQGAQGQTQQKHGFLQKRGASNVNTISSSAAAAAEKAAALALSESTNIHSLLSSKASNELVDAFARHEKERSNGEFTPSEGRKGRWILIYGILQTLASVAGDAPGLKYTEGVEYLLNCKLKGTPPWASGGGPADEGTGGIDDHHTRSHCWTIVRSWENFTAGSLWADAAAYGQHHGYHHNATTQPHPIPESARGHRERLSDQHYGAPLSPVLSTTSSNYSYTAPPRTPNSAHNESALTPRGLSTVCDTTDTEGSSYYPKTSSHHRMHGGRKRKAVLPRGSGIPEVPAVLSTQMPMRTLMVPRTRRGADMSGDEGDDEADDDEDVVMAEGTAGKSDSGEAAAGDDAVADAGAASTVGTSTAMRKSAKGKERERDRTHRRSLLDMKGEGWGMP